MNKKSLFAVILAGVMVATCVACNKNASNQGENTKVPGESIEAAPEKPHFQMMQREYPVSFTDSEQETVYVKGNLCKASVVAFDRVNSSISKKINGVLKSAYERNDKNADALMDVVMEVLADDSFDESTAGFPWYINSSYELVKNDGLMLTFKENVEYFDGTNDVDEVFYYHFDAKTGDQVPQVMYAEGDDKQRDAIDKLIFDRLNEKYNGIVSYDYVSSSIVETAVDGWYFTDNGIMLTFNVGEVAPADAGTLEVELTKNDLPEFAQQYFLD